ncbi:methylated-DNA--[protein]-cysteine S-methyltransferase [Fictibacillus gelatini]|uniref:methylated-DNA--[protein]-cysteine S-methyltransferase n=1 Tax=Fictibacillus gelatini TaxID=225985 RepID=UPI00041770EA|nr:methylated-DNA--[protein]-cysteine S-methyltransferase [Fictibacillus gelatini]
MMKVYKHYYDSPIGSIEIKGTNEAICSIMFCDKSESDIAGTPHVLMDCRNQLDEYFKGNRREFTFPYVLVGTEFQRTVWNALTKVTYGTIGTYKNIAEAIGNPRAIRAVGSANGKNKLSIVVPCHRIIGSNGALTGYAGGLWRKEWLLQHEKTFQ